MQHVLESVPGQIQDVLERDAAKILVNPKMLDKVIQANPKEAEAYRAGKHSLIGFFMGQVMRETRGAADPKLAQRLLRDKLE